jgi:hypothetical protein
MDFCRERFPIVHSLLQYSARREVTTPREVQLFRCSAALTCLEQGSSGSKLFPCAGIIGLGVAAEQRFVWSRKLELEPNASCGPGCLIGTRSAPTSGRQATLKRGRPDPLSRTTRNWSSSFARRRSSPVFYAARSYRCMSGVKTRRDPPDATFPGTSRR